ncbi:acetamidase [Enterocloster aldenensis]|uniref:acetamidase/formamidase family protein n=1 Tax=Enterocloster aldenensis TaxID=358742 RepID=UPI000E47FA9D|nr:acetamidase [Enterocloster aldenensis]
MANHTLNPSRGNLHGSLSRSIPPVLTISPGDTVDFTTLEADWRIVRPDSPSSSSGIFMERSFPADQGHALCGPVYIQGARPQMTLAIRINQIIPGTWGWSRVGGGDPDHLCRMGFEGDEYFLIWDIDPKKGICRSHMGHCVPLSPFMGVMAVAPDSDDYVKTHVPGPYGANMDCRDITTGSILYLPVYTEGALFSTGDGHARQGDGESGCTAIECPMKQVSLTFDLIDEPLDNPVCNSPHGWITFGFHSDLTVAAYYALMDMCRLMEHLYGFGHKEAMAMASVAVDMKITQLVNGTRGVHALLPHGVISAP